MKINKAVFTILILILSLHLSIVSAATPCVLLEFTDDTENEHGESAELLSDLVMEKLVINGKFSLKELRPIEVNEKEYLYDAWKIQKKNADIAKKTGNYDVLFEGEGFHEKKASSLTSAQKGQKIYPSLMKEIGEKNGAVYLIHGSIINFGYGRKVQKDAGTIAEVAGAVSGGALFPLFSNPRTLNQYFGVLVALRIIRSETGEVVWYRTVTGQSSITKFSTGMNTVQIGNDQVTEETYIKAMNDAAENLVEALESDLEANQLLL